MAVGKAHFEEVRAIEGAGGAAYQRRMEGSEERAEAAVRAGRRWREGGDLYRYGVSDTERRGQVAHFGREAGAGAEGRGRGGLPRAEADQGQGVAAVHFTAAALAATVVRSAASSRT